MTDLTERPTRWDPAGEPVSTDVQRSYRMAAAAEELLRPHPPWIPATPSALELAIGVASGTAAALASPLLAIPLQKLLAPLGADPSKLAPKPDEMGDPGWFGPDSVAWEVHKDPSLLIAGIAAFTLQSLHPLAMAGVAEHSAFSEDFLGRTRRTGDFVQGVVYGSSTEAARMCRTVYKIHKQVVGVAPDGRPYDANDPNLLHWVHVAEYATIVSANRRFGIRPMTRAQMDIYVGEVARVGYEVGMTDAPTDWNGINAALERHRHDLAVQEYAAHAVKFLKDPPLVPRAGMPVWRALWHGAIACLPPMALDLLGLKQPSSAELGATRTILRVLAAPGGDPPRLIAAKQRLGLA